MSGLAPNEREGIRQKVIDRLLLLYLYSKVSEVSRITGDVKLQKLAFLSEKSMIERDSNGFHYKFFRWDHGPMSKEVYEDREYLEENGLVSDYTGEIKKQGEEILSQASELVQDNSDFIKDINNVIDEYGRYSGSELKNIVYDVEVQPLTMSRSIRIENIPPTTDIYFPIPDELVEDRFDISDDWVSTLSILMDESASRSLDNALKKARKSEGRGFSFEHIDESEISGGKVQLTDVQGSDD